MEVAFLFELSSISRSYYSRRAYIAHLVWDFFQISGTFFLIFYLLTLVGAVSERQQIDLFVISWILWTLPMLYIVRSALSKVSRQARSFGKKLYDYIIGSTSLFGWITGFLALFEIIFPVRYPDVLVAYLTCFLAAWSIAIGSTIARATKNYKKVNPRELSKNPMLYVVYSLLLAWLLVTLLYCHASIIIHL